MLEMNIIVNGEKHAVTNEIVSYDDISKIVCGKSAEGLSIVYFGPKSKGARREGILSFGKKIAIEEGMIFNAMFTGNA